MAASVLASGDVFDTDSPHAVENVFVSFVDVIITGGTCTGIDGVGTAAGIGGGATGAGGCIDVAGDDGATVTVGAISVGFAAAAGAGALLASNT